MVVYPNAKINLGLYVTDKRADGFHNLESVFLPVTLTDILEFVPSNITQFQSTGIDIPGDANDNLCMKAWRLLNADYDIQPVAIHLHKQIPIGAGLGGGSADGAFMLKALNEFFKLRINEDRLEEYALLLGSDCPFFIRNKPSVAKGRGELLAPCVPDLSNIKIVLINPGIHISTAEAYAGVTIGFPNAPLVDMLDRGMEHWQDQIENVFEKTVTKKYPEISQIKARLKEMGALYAAMSGSGSTVYGIFHGDAQINLPADLQKYSVFNVMPIL